MRIKMLIGTVVNQKPRKPGDIVECKDADAKGLIATGQAEATNAKVSKQEKEAE